MLKRKLLYVTLSFILVLTTMVSFASNDITDEQVFKSTEASITTNSSDNVTMQNSTTSASDIKISNGKAYSKTKLIVKYKDNKKSDSIKKKTVEKANLMHFEKKKDLDLCNAELWEIDQNDDIDLTIDSLKSNPDVEFVEPDYLVYPAGNVEPYSLQSAHPYANNYTNTWTVTKSNATSIRVHFSYIETETNWDYITSSAGDSWTGSYTGVWSNFSAGSSINITLKTDSSNTKNGFIIDQIEYTTGTTATTPNDPYLINQWGIKNSGQTISGVAGTSGIDINALPAWNSSYTGSGVIVGVIDTGIYINHEDLANNIYCNTREIPNNNIDDDNNGKIDDYNGWDFVYNDKTVYDTVSDGANIDPSGHGTHVAGIIAGLGNNSKGIIGVASKAKILPLKSVGDSWGIGTYVSGVIDAISYANSLGAKVINCSFEISSSSSDALKTAMQNTPNILYVCAATNHGNNLPYYPAYYGLANMISVASITNSGALASTSNYGTNINIAAPGDNIYSTLPNNSYGYMSGTSMAAPFVSGIAAVLYSEHPTYTVSQIKSIILNNYTPISSLSGKIDVPGIPNLGNAIK